MGGGGNFWSCGFRLSEWNRDPRTASAKLAGDRPIDFGKPLSIRTLRSIAPEPSPKHCPPRLWFWIVLRECAGQNGPSLYVKFDDTSPDYLRIERAWEVVWRRIGHGKTG
jgi:hypothetical protein